MRYFIKEEPGLKTPWLFNIKESKNPCVLVKNTQGFKIYTIAFKSCETLRMLFTA